jgi:hypothetical protein
MAVTPSQRPTREWTLLLLALVLVVTLCIPLSQILATDQQNLLAVSTWDAERWGRLLLGPEQIACYLCFTWAGLIMLNRYMEVRRQRRAFAMPLLPTDEGARILYEDARPLQRRIEQVLKDRGPLILANMIRLALAKFIVSRSHQDASETVRHQAEVDQNRLATGLAIVHYLAWAIPALGFIGTVRGLGLTFTMARSDQMSRSTEEFLLDATRYLNVAFDATFVSLVLSLGVMFLIHAVGREEDELVIDCQDYCTEHLVNRLYEPQIGNRDSGTGNREGDYAIFPDSRFPAPDSRSSPGRRSRLSS